MEKIELNQILRTPSWRWIVTAYCFFVLFHLILFFFLSDFSNLFFRNVYWSRVAIVVSFLAFISMYIGYRSLNLTIFEPGIAAVLYILTLKIFLPSYLSIPTHIQNIYFIIEYTILGFVFAFGGAGIGFLIKRKRQIR